MAREEKLPPFSAEAEEAVLGSVLIDGEALVTLQGGLAPEDFFREQNRWVWEAMLALGERGEAVNAITVADELGRRGQLGDAGGPAYLGHLMANVPTALHAEHYGQIVRRASLSRQLIQAAGQIAGIGYRNEPDLAAALAKAEGLLYGIRAQQKSGVEHIRGAVERYLEETTVGAAGRARVQTGFGDLDGLLGGLYGGDLVLLAARPGTGKTSMLLNLAEQVVLGQGRRVVLFSLEMAGREIVERFLASRALVPLQRLRLGHTDTEELQRVLAAAGELSEGALYLDEGATQRVSEIRAKSLRLHRQRGVDLVLIDYLQMVEGATRGRSRVEELGEVTRGLKGLAKELGVPVLAAAQLNRAVESRPSHRPLLSDLRDSGSSEQDSDVVMFLYREDQYSDEREWGQRHPGEPYPRGVTELIIAKHRNGPTGSVKLMFDELHTRFRGLAPSREGQGGGDRPTWWGD